MKPNLRLLTGLSFIALLASCSGEPEWVAVYEDCKKQITVVSEEMNKTTEDSNESPEMKAMMESMGQMTLNIGLSACELIRSTCENDPDGNTCQSVIEQSKNRNL